MDASKLAKVMKPIVAVVGMQNKLLVKIPGVGQKMVEGSSKGLGKVVPHLGFLGFRKEPSYENAVWNWEIYLSLLGAKYEKEVKGPQEITYKFTKCPAGYAKPGDLSACVATMKLDHTIVELSGARLIVEKCMPNDGVCVETLVAR
ncbi:MAG: hypothetical protein ACYC55_05070 [Candidatus Geothermincolia bacterium]